MLASNIRINVDSTAVRILLPKVWRNFEVMQAQRLATIPIDIIWQYRELKQDGVPVSNDAFIGVNRYDVVEVADYIRHFGIEPVELCIIGATALLTDGNHRIAAAKYLGYETVPVVIKVLIGNGNFSDLRLTRFIPINEELEAFLKKVFLKPASRFAM